MFSFYFISAYGKKKENSNLLAVGGGGCYSRGGPGVAVGEEGEETVWSLPGL